MDFENGIQKFNKYQSSKRNCSDVLEIVFKKYQRKKHNHKSLKSKGKIREKYPYLEYADNNPNKKWFKTQISSFA